MIERDNRVVLDAAHLDPTVVGTISENDGSVEEYTGLADTDSVKLGGGSTRTSRANTKAQ